MALQRLLHWLTMLSSTSSLTQVGLLDRTDLGFAFETILIPRSVTLILSASEPPYKMLHIPIFLHYRLA